MIVSILLSNGILQQSIKDSCVPRSPLVINPRLQLLLLLRVIQGNNPRGCLSLSYSSTNNYINRIQLMLHWCEFYSLTHTLLHSRTHSCADSFSTHWSQSTKQSRSGSVSLLLPPTTTTLNSNFWTEFPEKDTIYASLLTQFSLHVYSRGNLALNPSCAIVVVCIQM